MQEGIQVGPEGGADLAAEIRARVAPMLGIVLRASAVVLAVVTIAALVSHGPEPVWPIFWAFGGCLLVALALERAGRVRAAGIVLPLGFWVIASTAVFMLGGVRSPGTFVLVPIVATAAVFWDLRAAGALTVASLGVELLAAWLESVHRLPTPWRTSSPAALWRVFAGSIVMTGVLAGVSQRAVRDAIADVRRMTQNRSAMEAELAVLRRRLEQSRRFDAIGRVAGGAAHDFSNLIGVILAASGILERETRGNAAATEVVKAVEESALRARNLLRHLLTAGNATGSPKPLEVGGVVTGLEPVLRNALGRAVDLVVRTDDAGCLVRADPSRLEQVILNLVVNARDAMPEGGKLVVEAARGRLAESPEHPLHDAVRLAVTDSGVGMDPETQRRAFKPFFTTKGGEGTGLGLSTVLEVVNENGGEVRVTSSPGRGTTFEVFLPRFGAS